MNSIIAKDTEKKNLSWNKYQWYNKSSKKNQLFKSDVAQITQLPKHM